MERVEGKSIREKGGKEIKIQKGQKIERKK
jgi:hypothetical protein